MMGLQNPVWLVCNLRAFLTEKRHHAQGIVSSRVLKGGKMVQQLNSLEIQGANEGAGSKSPQISSRTNIGLRQRIVRHACSNMRDKRKKGEVAPRFELKCPIFRASRGPPDPGSQPRKLTCAVSRNIRVCLHCMLCLAAVT